MKVLLIGNYLPDGQESMLRFANLVAEGALALGHQVRLIRPATVFGRLPVSSFAKKYLGYIDKLIIFPFVIIRRAIWADVAHVCDHSNAFYLPFLLGKPSLVTCHDLFAVRSARGDYLQHSVGRAAKLMQSWVAFFLPRFKAIACVSAATRADFISLFQEATQRTHVIYLGLSYPYFRMDRSMAMARLSGIGVDAGADFFMHVGNNNWYKNRAGLLDIFAELLKRMDTKPLLLLVGKEMTSGMLDQCDHLGITSNVRSLSGVSNEELCALYSCSKGLIFPSLKEGFGWPVLEAHACGCPVFTTNMPPMTEVGGSGAAYFDPSDPCSASLLIYRSLGNLEVLSVKGFENSHRFSSEKMMQAYSELYRVCAE